jgi:hypothetical protein
MGSALHAKVVMAKLFPKLVSSLAVLLLLCQFGYVACQPTGFSNSSRYLPDGEGTHIFSLSKQILLSFRF